MRQPVAWSRSRGSGRASKGRRQGTDGVTLQTGHYNSTVQYYSTVVVRGHVLYVGGA